MADIYDTVAFELCRKIEPLIAEYKAKGRYGAPEFVGGVQAAMNEAGRRLAGREEGSGG